MIDFHSHILPGMDDGSKSVEESLTLLREEKKQGVTDVVLTPHFYPENEKIESFTVRRKESAKRLSDTIRELNVSEFPRLYLGAEVAYYYGISRSSDLYDLCIGGTKCIMIEMPFAKWSESMIKEITLLDESCGVQTIIAHVERYRGIASKKLLNTLIDSGAMLQVNSEYFVDKHTRKKALKMFGREQIAVLGTDSHNMNKRPPTLGTTFGVISEKFGREVLECFNEIGEQLLHDAEVLV